MSHEFSFFPDEGEQELIKTATVPELVVMFSMQPEMSARFAHELIRTGRKDDLQVILQVCLEQQGILSKFLNDLLASTAMMRAMFDIPKEVADTSIADTVNALSTALIAVISRGAEELSTRFNSLQN